MRCKDCIYWSDLDWKTTFREPVDYKIGKCSCPSFVESETPPKDGLEYWDAEGYLAGFHVGEDFGCIHFKKKELR